SYYFYIFFSSRRRHTRSKRDWSSDVCSSDLLVHADDVHVALAQDVPLGGGLFGHVEGEQRAGLFVDHRFGAVDVLGLGVVQHAAAKSDDVAPHVDDGHHDPVAEDIVQVALGAALDQAGQIGRAHV